MNFDYSDDQKFVKDGARKFLTNSCPPSVVRAVSDDESKGYDAALWKDVAGMGWLGVSIPEAYGGVGLTRVDLCAIAEEMGRVVAPLPFSSTVYLFTEAVLLNGTEDQRERLLPAIAAGDLIGCLAVSEGPGTTHPQSVVTTVSDGRLTGTKIPVTDGGIAHQAIVLATEAGRPGLFLVDLHGEGVTRNTLQTLDPARNSASLTFNSTPAKRLGDGGDGAAQLRILLDRAAALIAFEQLGGADRCLEMARDYALERYAFGRPIGGYQAIKHKLADMYIRNQLARSNAYYGAWALEEGNDKLGRAAAAARVAASEAYWFAAKEMIEIFGGIGTTWESDCHLYYRRAKQLAVMIGGPALWKERLIAELERENAV
jgi:alkylation response protein AidB-like acyl-CoA dehydrogenase